MAAGRSQLVGRDRSTSSLRGYHTTTAGTGASEAGSLATHSGSTAVWSLLHHVDCCTMVGQNTHRTNEESKVVGMHR